VVKQPTSKVLDLSPANIRILNASLQAMNFTFLSHSSLDRFEELVTDFISQLFDLRCPLIKVYIDPDRVASRRLKELRRTNDVFRTTMTRSTQNGTQN